MAARAFLGPGSSLSGPALPAEVMEAPGVAARTRRRYSPLPHPGTRDRWSGPAVVNALKLWTAETGRPPRRQDWTGETQQPPGDAQRKWMREHPRWPSSSCVADHFGSWGAALRTAGLPVRGRPFATTIADRVIATRALAAEGASVRQIAERLGVSPASAHNYLHARDCPGCGGPITNPHATLCTECTRHLPTVERTWTRAQVRAAIDDWQREHGAPPSYREWTPSRERPGRWEAESPRWPSAAVVCDLYGDEREPWNAALRDADQAIRMRRWSDEAVRSALGRFWARKGRPPAPADLLAPAWDGPCGATLRRRYGGLAAAWSELSPVPAEATLISDRDPTAPEPRR
jgi:AcrR family transcriptional regulator